MTRTKRSIASFLSLLLVQITTVAIGFVSTPMLLHLLGDERYGAFRVALDLREYLMLLELGIGGALLSILAQAVSRQATVEIALSVAIRIYVKLLGLMVLGGIGLSAIVVQVASVSGTIAHELQLGFYISIVNLLWLPLNVFYFLADASQRTYFRNLLIIIQSSVVVALSLGFAALGFGIPGQFVAIFLGSSISGIAIAWDGFRRYPRLIRLIFDPPAKAAQQVKQQLWQLNVPMLILQVVARVSLLTDTVFVAYFMGTAAIVPFVMTQRLATLAQTQLQSVALSTWAALAELYASDRRQDFNARLVELTQLIVVIGLTLMIPIAAYNRHFIMLWMDEARFAGRGVTLLVVCNGILRSVLYLWEFCFTGTGHIRQVVPLAISGMILNVTVSIVATQHFGMIGPLIGTLMSSIILYSWWLPKLLQKTFGTSPTALALAIVRPLVVGVPYGALVVWFADQHTPFGWLGLATEMSAAAMLHGVLTVCFVLSATDRKQWKHRILSIVPRFNLQA